MSEPERRERGQSMTDLARYQDPFTIQRVLHSAKTIAIVGLSANELRASYFVGYYLRRHGYRVIPVNPRETEILGQKCYPSLLDVPEPVHPAHVARVLNLEAAVHDHGQAAVLGDPRALGVDHAELAP